MITPTIKVDTTGFNRAFKQYMQHSKKDLADIVNTKAYFIARNAVNSTRAVDRAHIESELMKPSNTNSAVPLAAIIVNKQRVAKGEKGVAGAKLNAAVRKFINMRKRTANFLRAGWIPAIKAVEKFVEKKSGPSFRKVDTKGKPKGGGSGARVGTWSPVASIWNEVFGSLLNHGLNKANDPSKVQSILTRGLQVAIDKEVASMKAYVEKKLNASVDKFNRR